MPVRRCVVAALAVVLLGSCADGNDDAAPPASTTPGTGVDAEPTSTTTTATDEVDTAGPDPTAGSGLDLATPAASDPATVAAVGRFLDTYVAADGRVVRHDQGGDTVSEGQAYAMLAAVAVGDRERFDATWSWARANLERPDGLLSWHWRDGAVVDPQPAPDADLDAAWALAVASHRFDEPTHATDAARIATAVLDHSSVDTPDGPVVVAGPWAVADGVVNPSYWSPRAFDALGALTDDPRWDATASASRGLLADLTAAPPHLAPDWAVLSADRTGATPRDDPATFGWDASRTLMRVAVSCDSEDRELAARSWTAHFSSVTEDGATAPAAVWGLDGSPQAAYDHPSMTSAVAAAAWAAGDRSAADALLALADDADERSSSYYGSALVAVTRAALTTDSLGACVG